MIGDQRATDGPRGRILVVDDDPAVRLFLHEFFLAHNYRVTEVGTCREALAAAEEDELDLVLLDIGLADGSGMEVLDFLQRKSPHTAVVMLSARDDPDHIIGAIRRGAQDYILKPFSTQIIKFVTDRVFEGRRLRQQNLDYSRQLQRNVAELRRLQELKDDMTSMVIHDLKQPLSQVLGNIELCELTLPQLSPERLSRHLANMHLGCEDMSRMIQTMLNIVQMENGELGVQLEAIPTSRLLEDSFRRNQPVAVLRKHSLELRPSPPLVATADSSIVTRMLDNLVANALKHTPEGCRVELSAAPSDRHLVELAVSDNGPGIPVEYHGRVFEKFGRRAHQAVGRGDTGFGLAFCKMAAALQGGSIRLESSEGEGCRFVISLPQAGA